MKMKQPTALIILDGLGYREQHEHNAVTQADTPTLAFLHEHYPHKLIKASGEAVGLLDGTVGNSEVGHLTIGTGRTIKQPSVQITELINTNKLAQLPIIHDTLIQHAKTQKTLHILGLLSQAGVHAQLEHLLAFIDAAHAASVAHIALHCFLDGRDSPPRSATQFLQKLENHIRTIPQAYIATICGRFYAMDRNQEWERTHRTYQMLTQPQTILFPNWQTALDVYYKQNIYDEFIPPTQLTHAGVIHDGDGIILTNFRPDRARQLVHAFLDEPFTHFKRTKLQLAFFITPGIIDPTVVTQTILAPQPLSNTLMDVLHEHGLHSMAIAETEKYAHVTYFFNAGRERQHETEQWIIIPSISARTYEQFPCMRAPEITTAILDSLKNDPQNFYVINYANPDMVGHSGNELATIKAIECLDRQLAQLYHAIVEERDGTIYLTADHGNAEFMYDEAIQQPHTAHTSNPVEFFVINKKTKNKSLTLPLHGLKDIAPFILKEFGLPIPLQMGP